MSVPSTALADLDQFGGLMKFEAPASLRNREPIWQVLEGYLPQGAKILEIASGSGEHASYFCKLRNDIFWQPSDMDPRALASLNSWALEVKNMEAPLELDIHKSWPVVNRYDLALCVNMLHISPWSATEALFKNLYPHLVSKSYLIVYGPFLEEQVETASSNLAFDQSLRTRNALWGIRQKEDVLQLAEKHGFKFEKRVAMPANNLILVFKRL